MKVELLHPFFNRYKDAILLFEGCRTMGSWISRQSKIAKMIEADPSKVSFKSDKSASQDIANDFRGVSFEGFTEIFFHIFGIDPRIGIRDCRPFSGKDYGVDLVGIGNNGHPATIQCKFRTEYDKVLKGDKDHLHNFVIQSWEDCGVPKEDTENMLIITTGKEVYYDDMTNEWNNKVRYIALNQSWGCFRGLKYQPQDPTNIFSLRAMTDHNLNFWITATNIIFENYK